ncbi:MAG: NAD(P)-dependent oxidoreductase [Pseudodesulfovibrio sp.]|jgi:glutamate synthase (NADPH/NADH) small chain|uniref:Dihydropyrimidine dehydrogenase n=1 Tax=Pseudodesulfovibrio indicus TaxID=1716143 RepID=A0A126QLI7_9BACT|nr:NAD(P)-dependent oxidoreductase [Pseudodesulfovibrio indicus]AMK10923.1 dihydropyrimidine dehydrogenase [Pseudodesulfovibrio indicus]TDT91915.1 glutamate synthase (NADPH/NADH) small chain [Pseudodesulfovibrio indicus]
MGKHILEEASRCLKCKKPLCSKGCPVSTPANLVIEALLEGDMLKAGAMLFENNPLTAVCSLICPHENFCEGHCILGKKSAPVQVSDIEQYISRYYLEQFTPKRPVNANNAKRIAIVGSGPAGITVAFLLAGQGFDVTLFESKERIGGVLQYGIPDFRLPKDILERLKDKLIGLGVKIRPNTLIGPVISIDDLFRDDYKAVFIGTGVWNPRPLKLKGETLGHVHYAIHYLKNPNVYSLGRKVAVIGAGNVAMDVARTALRKGAQEVTILYRRGEDDISATRYEYDYARMDGVRFRFHASPVEIVDRGIVVVDTETVHGEDGRARVVPVEGSESLFEADSVFIAVSQAPRNNLSGLEVGKTGLVITDEEGRTTRPGVFASGDVVTGAKTVAEAVSFSKRSARAIVDYVDGLDG